MSKVAIKGNASGTGTFTLEAPNSNTDRSLTLPDEAGTVLTSASVLSNSNMPAGSQVLITDNSGASSQTHVDVTLPTSGYDFFIINLYGLYSDGSGVSIVRTIEGGSKIGSNDSYRYAGFAGRDVDTAPEMNKSSGATYGRLGYHELSNSSSDRVSIRLYVYNSTSSSLRTQIFSEYVGYNLTASGQFQLVLTGITRTAAATCSGISFQTTSGSQTYAGYQLFGVTA